VQDLNPDDLPALADVHDNRVRSDSTDDLLLFLVKSDVQEALVGVIGDFPVRLPYCTIPVTVVTRSPSWI
ncbi:MAG TPA: hypothetical protein VIN09_03355, partial [Chloroflexota bacterium]